ncbi:MAG: glycosyltransferase [Bacteroidales bacterium]|nr:glycosyltransferase [Bacteroidales bacterium]MBN2750652.1 glycosyltransferase [Bacteroidales bacterium]
MSDFLYQLSIYELILAGVLFLGLVIQLYYYLGVFLKVANFNGNPSNNIQPPVSIVICARDEEANLSTFLPLVLEQSYPNYEVVVVNDCSSDDTDMVLERLMRTYKHLRVTTIKQDEKFTHTKKLALTIGIKAAKHDWLLLTDADCRPESKNWLSTMAVAFTQDNEVVLGYGGFIPEKGLTNKIVRLDALYTAMLYLGAALVRKPYMGVGRNLAYKRNLFFSNKGFASHSQLASGDDDLFVNEVATSNNTTVVVDPGAHTRTYAKRTFNSWLNQKRRHLTTGSRYKSGSKWYLGTELFSRYLFYGSAIALIALQAYPLIIAGIISLRLIIRLSVIKAVMIRLKERKILLISLVYDFISPIIFGTIVLTNKFSTQKTKWR